MQLFDICYSQDELVIVGQTKDDTMEEKRPEHEIKKSIEEFIHRLEQSDKGKKIFRA